MVAKRYLDVDPGHAGRGRRDRQAGVPIGREVVAGAVGVAALDVSLAVVMEQQRVIAGQDCDRVSPVGRSAGRSEGANAAGVDVDVRQRRCPIGPGDLAADAVAERHLDVDPGHAGRAHPDRRAGVPGREVVAEAAGVIAALDVGPAGVAERQRVVAGRDRK